MNHNQPPALLFLYAYISIMKKETELAFLHLHKLNTFCHMCGNTL